MIIPSELVDQFSRSNGAIFVGAGLSTGAGLPSWGELVERLKAELEDCPPEASYPDIAQYYLIRHGKNRLISRIREELDTFNIAPTSVHRSLAQLGISPLFTTNYDNLLEKALVDAGIRFDTVITTADANFWTSDRIQLVKIHGEINQPETVVITSEDYERYYYDHPALTRLLATTLQTRTLLLLGYSAVDIDFRLLLTQIQSEAGAYARNAFAVMFDAPDLVVQDMNRRGIKIINLADIPENRRNDFLAVWLRELTEKVSEMRLTLIKKTHRPKLPQEPYKFLHWFGEEDIAIFHGRDYEINRLASLVETQRVTILHGESGTGKTSLLRAGVIPLLRDKGHIVAYFRPLTNPFMEAQEALKAALGRSQGDLISIQEIVADQLPAEKTLLIVLDQFEEFFIRQGGETRQEFEKALDSVLEIPNKRVHVLFCIRSDYLDRLDELEDIFSHDPLRFRIRLHNLGPASATAAILEPAKDFGINFDQSLLEKLVSDLDQGWIAPPQLQIVCYSLWRDWTDRGNPPSGLTFGRYLELGSTEEILSNYLTRVIEDLGDVNILKGLSVSLQVEVAQIIAKAILKSLITSERTKIAVSSKEITQGELVSRLSLPPAHIDAILRYLQNRRIVRHVPESQYYELAHEVMIGQIWAWVTDDERRILDIQDILQRAITDYRRFQTLLSPEYLSLVSENVADLTLTEDELELLLISAINYNYTAIMWVEKMRADQVIEILGRIIAAHRKVLYAQIALALGYTKSPKAVRLLDELCREENRDTQRAAAMAMARLGFRSVIPPLFHALMREEHLLRAAPFLEALETLRFEDSIAMLRLASLGHKDIGVRKRALNSLLRLNTLDGFELLSKQLLSEDSLVYSTSIYAFEKIMEEKPEETASFFRRSNPETRIAILRGLSNTQGANARDLLGESIADPELRIRREAILMLGRVNDRNLDDLLVSATTDAAPDLRSLAIETLGKTGDTRYLETILIFSNDADTATRMAAFAALDKMKGNQVTDALLHLLGSPEKQLQPQVVRALSLRTDQYTIDSLKNSLAAENIEVRQQAEAALRTLSEVRRLDSIIVSLEGTNQEARRQALSDLRELDFGALVESRAEEELNALVMKEWDIDIKALVQSCIRQIRTAREVPALLVALANSDVEMRRRATEELGNPKYFGHPQAIEALISCLRDNDPGIRKRTVAALGKIGGIATVDNLIDSLKDGDVGVRREAAMALANLADIVSFDPPVHALKDKDAEVRRQSAIALRSQGHKRAVDALIRVLKDTVPNVREAAAESLGRFRDERAAEALVMAMKDENTPTRIQAAIALAKLGDHRAVDVLRTAVLQGDSQLSQQAGSVLDQLKVEYRLQDVLIAIKGGDIPSRGNAATALGLIKDMRAVDALILALKYDSNALVRKTAVISLARIGDDRAIAALVAALKDKSLKVGEQAAIALAMWKPGSLVDRLLEALQGDDVSAQQRAAYGLGHIKAVQAVDVLILALNHTNAEVRRQSAMALGLIRDKRAIDALIRVLKDTVPKVRQASAASLGLIRDNRAIEALMSTSKDESKKVREEAVRALAMIRKSHEQQ